MATEDTYEATRLERILGTMVVSIVAVCVLAFLAIVTAGITQLDLTSPVGNVILVLPGIGLPIAFVLMMTLLIVNMIRRRRDAAKSSR
jgi:TRAP-type C4-dicarboxylate transport system permease small subunit